MRNSRLLSIMRKELIQITRDRRIVIITFIQPILMLFLLGFAATTDVRNVPIALFDQDHSSAARDLLAAYRAADYFQFNYDVNSVDEIRSLMTSGSVKGALVIPPDYGKRVAVGEPAQVQFIIDGSDPTIASTELAAAVQIGQSKSTQVLQTQLAARGQTAGLQSPVDVRTQVWYNPDLVSAYFLIPGLVGTILQQLAVMLTAASIVRERERGTIEQLIITPIRSWELIVGKVTPYVGLAFFNVLEVLIVGLVIFKVPLVGDIGLLLGTSMLFLTAVLGIGLFISTAAKTQQEAQMMSMLIQLPSLFLAGIFFPIAAMPPFLQFLSYFIPLRYFNEIVRAIMLKGATLQDIRPQVFALVIFAVLIMGGAALRFRKRLD
ncbi:MAG TPA: ABC transporter permease [Anaerolineae bacterium]|nr:ABC transporter permease [Anaerolineae bacterium]